MAVAILLDVTAGLLLVLRAIPVRVKAFVCLAVGLTFAWYHVAGMLLGVRQHCPCLGLLNGWLPVSESFTKSALLSFVSYMVVAGFLSIALTRKSS